MCVCVWLTSGVGRGVNMLVVLVVKVAVFVL